MGHHLESIFEETWVTVNVEYLVIINNHNKDNEMTNPKSQNTNKLKLPNTKFKTCPVLFKMI